MIGEPVTRLRRAQQGVDRYQNPVWAWLEEPFTGAAFDPGGSREPVEVGRAQTVTTPKLYFTSEVGARADDRWVVRGLTYETTGRPAVWVSPFTGGTSGTVVELALTEG